MKVLCVAALSALLPALAEAQRAPEAEPHPVLLRASAGMGVGTRGFSRPTELGEQRLPDAVFPAAAVAMRVHGWRGESLSLAGSLSYQTSFGLSVTEPAPFAIPNEVGARAAHTALSVAPVFVLSARPVIQLSVPVGVTLRSFWPDVRELTTPGYSLFGPHLGVEALAPLLAWLELRVGPELQAILVLDEHMKAAGLRTQGFALGGEAAFTFGPLGAFSLELGYRESHAFIANRSAGPNFEDTERFLILSFQGAL